MSVLTALEVLRPYTSRPEDCVLDKVLRVQVEYEGVWVTMKNGKGSTYTEKVLSFQGPTRQVKDRPNPNYDRRSCHPLRREPFLYRDEPDPRWYAAKDFLEQLGLSDTEIHDLVELDLRGYNGHYNKNVEDAIVSISFFVRDTTGLKITPHFGTDKEVVSRFVSLR